MCRCSERDELPNLVPNPETGAWCRGELLATLHQLDEEEDINKVLKYFSYEHFYVIYCKVRPRLPSGTRYPTLAFLSTVEGHIGSEVMKEILNISEVAFWPLLAGANDKL